MAINPLIALSGRPVEMPNFAGMRAQMLSGNAIEQDMALKQAQVERDLAAQQQMREMLGQLGANPTQEQRQAVIGRVAAVSPKMAGDLQDFFYKGENNTLQLEKARQDAKAAAFKSDQERTAAFANIANSVLSAPEPQRMEAYQRGLQVAVQRGLVKPDQAQQMAAMPFEQVAPYLQALVGSTIAPKDQQAMTFAQQAEARAKADEQRKVEEHNATLPGKRVGPDGLTPSQRVQNDQAQMTTDIKNWRQAQKEGYKGSFEQWQKDEANRRPRTSVTVNNGGGMKLSDAMSYAQHFGNEKAVKDYDVISGEAERARAVMSAGTAGRIKLNQVDQVLINVFNKIVSPDSVVRESEYERMKIGQALRDQIEGIITRLKKGGGGLSESERQNVFTAITEMESAARNRYLNVEQKYRTLGEKFGVPAEALITRPASGSPTAAAGTNLPTNVKQFDFKAFYPK